MALSSGVDVKTLSSMLGHYSAGFTLDTYTHITNDMQRGAAEKIGGFMETATAKPEPEPPDPPEESRCKVTVRESGITGDLHMESQNASGKDVLTTCRKSPAYA